MVGSVARAESALAASVGFGHPADVNSTNALLGPPPLVFLLFRLLLHRRHARPATTCNTYVHVHIIHVARASAPDEAHPPGRRRLLHEVVVK